MAFIDLSGHRFGKWTVLKRTARVKTVEFWCQCDCGAERAVLSESLRQGKSLSCGSHPKDETASRPKNAYPQEYNSWAGMRQRCNYPGHAEFGRYGGRGIKLCDRWNSFETFLADMGPRPQGCSIERKDNDKDYCPENCVWASREQQAANKSTNVKVVYNGKEFTLKQLASELGISYFRLHAYYRRRGLSLEEAIAAVQKPGINRPYRFRPSSGKAPAPQRLA